MDIDRFIATHQGSWDRLDELVSTARRSVRKLSPEELDELLALYHATSSHLSIARTSFDDVGLSNRLSRTLGGARGLIYRPRSHPARALATFFSETFPAAAWAGRRAAAVAALILFAPAFGYGIWLAGSGQARAAAIDEHTQELLAEREFAAYYSSSAAEGWAFELLTHNIRVAATAYAGGVMGGVGGVYLLFVNGSHLGQTAAVMHAYDRGAQFWGLITPHGLIELTAVVLASGAGLRVAWAMIAPGDRTRLAAVAEEGQRSITVLLGTMVMFVVAGFTEAFVTPSSLPTAGRVTIGVVIELAALAWAYGMGRNVEALGLTGRLGEDRGADLLVRAGPSTSR